jgi:hypothetical protein
MVGWRAQHANRAARPLLAGATTVALLIAGCGSATVGDGAQLDPRSAAVLAPWAAFPVQAAPRPVVIIGQWYSGPVNFASGPDKMAFLNGSIDPPQAFPPGPKSAAGYPLITAQAGFARLKTGLGDSESAGTVRLRITEVRLSEASFDTDRGWKTLPAWNFSFAGVEGPVSVLALAPSALWSPPGQFGAGRVDVGAKLAQDGQGLTLNFTGMREGNGPCTSTYTVTLAETGTAVAVRIVTHPYVSTIASNGPYPIACDLMGYARSASVRLKTRLGNRVLVDAEHGGAIAAIES